eukprot:5097546-Karenia_brevis.AAC.1
MLLFVSRVPRIYIGKPFVNVLCTLPTVQEIVTACSDEAISRSVPLPSHPLVYIYDRLMNDMPAVALPSHAR